MREHHHHLIARVVPVADKSGRQTGVVREPLERGLRIVVGIAITVGDDVATIAGRLADGDNAGKARRVFKKRREESRVGAEHRGRIGQAGA